MGKKEFSVTVSTISGGPVDNILKIIDDNTIEPKYYFRMASSMLLSLFAQPFRWWEHIRYDSVIKKYEFERDPIFVLGHWRSGTTFLHNLLCQDPMAGFVTTYHGIFPELLLGSKWLFKNFMRLTMPTRRPSDNVRLSADFPQEEEFALGNVNPYGFYNFWFFPKKTREYYDKYVAFEGVSDAIKEKWKQDYIRLAKKALINTGRQRFISKNPPHTGRIKRLLEMFPNAKFVHIYRNPVTVFISTKKLILKTIPPLNFHDISEREIEENIFWIYKKMIHGYLGDRKLVKPENLVEIKFEEFEEDPLPRMRKIYEQLNLDDYERAEPLFKRYIESQKSYKKNKYKLSRKKVDQILGHWQFAMDEWGYDLPENIEIV